MIGKIKKLMWRRGNSKTEVTSRRRSHGKRKDKKRGD